MKYVVDIPRELADEVNKQVRSGKYKSPQDFMLAAIQNQTYLETVEVAGDSQQTVVAVAPPRSSDDKLYQSMIDFLKGPAAKTAVARLLMPPNAAEVNTVRIGNALRHNYLPGFSNRLFPAKPIVRVLGNLLEESGSEYIALDELQEKSAEIARELGKAIQRKDKTMGRKRGTIISAGLPVGREDKAKSRFKNQFVGFIGKGRLEGETPTLRFLEIVKDGNSDLAGITDSGLKFAALPNPILDKQDYAVPFSEEEVAFLLDHIATQLPGEAKLMRLILKSVRDGVATPDEMTGKVESWRRHDYEHQWTKNEVIAMRVGVISRMSELGLLGRQKDGVKVTYVLTERGENYLGRLTDLGS